MEAMEVHYWQVLACFCKHRLNPANEHISDRLLFHHVADEMKFTINGKGRPLPVHVIIATPSTDTCYDYEPDMRQMYDKPHLESEYPYWSFVFNAMDGLVWHSVMVG